MLSQSMKQLSLQTLYALCVVIFLINGVGSKALGQSADEAMVRSLAVKYFELYQKKDMAGLLQMWSNQSPDFAAAQQSLPKTFGEVEKLEIKNFAIGKVSFDGDKASARVSFEISAIPLQTGKPLTGYGKWKRTLYFSREGKQWQVWRAVSSEEELVAMIGASQTDAQRQSLVEGNQQLQTAEFISLLTKYGRQQFDQGQVAEALSLYNLAVTITEKIGDLSGKADALRLIGLYHVRQGRPEQGLQYYKDSLSLAKEAGNRELTAKALNSLGAFYWRVAEFKQALGYYQEMRTIAEELQDDSLLFMALNNSALVYQAIGELLQGLDIFKQALVIARKLGNKRQMVTLMTNIGDNHRLLGNYDEAVEYHQNALATAEQYDYKLESISAGTGLGAAYNSKGMYTKALEEYEKARITAESLNEKAYIAKLKVCIGGIKQQQGDFSLAFKLYNEALKIAYELNEQVLISTVLTNMAQAYTEQGDYVKALDYTQQSLTLSEHVDDQEGVLIAINNIGTVYQAQSNYAQALKYYQRSLNLAEKSNNKAEVARGLINIGTLYLEEKDYAKALKHSENLLALSKTLNDKVQATRNLQYVAEVYNHLQNPAKALEYYLQALKFAEEVQHKLLLNKILCGIGSIYYQQKDYTKALEYANRASVIARQINNPTEIWQATLLAGKAYRALNRNDQALQSFSESIGVIERLREQLVGGEQERQRFFENKSEPYDELIELFLAQNQFAEALTYAERFKGRVLLDTLQSGKVNVLKAMSAQEQQKERHFQSEQISLNSQISYENQKQKSNEALLKDLNLRLQKARQEYEDFQFRLYAAHPELKIQRGDIQPVTLADANTLLPDGKTALLEFVVKDDKAFLFVITKKTSLQKTVIKQPNSLTGNVDLQVYPLNIKQRDLQALTQTFVKAISIRSAGYKQLAAQLYNTLLKPAQAQLRNISNLVIVPDDVLWELPFQALQSAPHRFLVQDYAISYAPSLTVLREMSKKKKSAASPATLLALGNPNIGKETKNRVEAVYMGEKLEPLPEAERQVKALAQLYGARQSKTYIGTEAREERVKQEASRYKILHLATHGILNNTSPMYSHLVLSQSLGNVNEDGLLEAWEIMKLDLNADLVVLSACDTARGKVSAGEGVIGLSWSLFVAGCPSVVVSQWKVESSSTTELMLEFHRRLKGNVGEAKTPTEESKARPGKSEAMRQAALKLLKSPEYSHPFYWAAFIVVGDNSWK
jgi:CHAT domain-containing protein